MPKKCVNGNCSRRKECGTYHQAKTTFEAAGGYGKFERHTCKKGKCDHFTVKEYVPYGDEWRAEKMKAPKSALVSILKMTLVSHEQITKKYNAVLELVKRLEGRTI